MDDLFSDVNRSPLEAHQPITKPLKDQLSPRTSVHATTRMQARKPKFYRAVDLDNLCAELLKHGPAPTPQNSLSSLRMRTFTRRLWQGGSICHRVWVNLIVSLPKPGNPAGPVTCIRPRVLFPLIIVAYLLLYHDHSRENSSASR
jgi:hypothetical protein